MYYAVFYDISNNKTRRLAEKLCKQAGLVRMQRSVFGGSSDHSRIQEIGQELSPLLNPLTDSLAIQPLDALSYRRLTFEGKPVDKALLAREKKFVLL